MRDQETEADRLREARQQQRTGGGSTRAVGIAGVSRQDFYAYMVEHKYIYAPTGDLWPAGSVNARLPSILLEDDNGNPVRDSDGAQVRIPASRWLDRHRPVEQMTWIPGEPMLVRDRLVVDGGWIDRERVTVFNRYRPPLIVPGNAAEAQMWLDHIDKVYPDDAEHIIKWLAHRRQRPHDKINHALVLGGAQGVGKDSRRRSSR